MMKRYILIVVVNLITKLTCFAQVSHAFPDSSASWSETQIIYGGPGDPWEYSVGRFVVDGDTSFFGIDYNKLYWFEYCDTITQGIVGYYRVDSMKVYYRDEFSLPIPPLVNLPYVNFMINDTGEVLLYDFSLQVGDTFLFQSGFIDSVSLVDSVLLNGAYYKKITFQNMVTNGSLDPYYWIEGIGSTYGFYPAYYVFENALFFNCFTSNTDSLSFGGLCPCSPVGISEYLNEDYEVHINPNLVVNSTTISFSTYKEHTFGIYDLLGNEVKRVTFTGKDLELVISDFKSGMYFLKMENEYSFSRKFVVQ